jgi:nucleoside-diphosphate-sugar epimerase
VVFGTGQAGSALAAQLAALGVAVRAVSRHRRSRWGTGWRAADAADPEVADAAKGNSVVRQCVNARIAVAGAVLVIGAGVLALAGRTGALLVVENLRGYGRAEGKADAQGEGERS